jgi:CheY-like chemotaxis protein
VSQLIRTEPVQNDSSVQSFKTVLLVDDRDATRLTTKWFLANFGFSVETARNGEEALALFDAKLHDLVLTDNTMPGMTGIEMAHIIKMRSPSTPVVMYTRKPPDEQSSLDLVIKKPAHLLSVKEAIEHCLRRTA